MKAEDNQSILIDSLVEQFSGNAFASLIVEHYKKLNLEDTVSSMLGIMEEIPIDEKELESWMDSINSIASDYGEGFWSEDCGKIYKLIAAKAKIYLINHSIPIIDNNIRQPNAIGVLKNAVAVIIMYPSPLSALTNSPTTAPTTAKVIATLRPLKIKGTAYGKRIR